MSKNWDLLSFVSHELKTPLSTLKLNIEELKGKTGGKNKIIKDMEEELNWMIQFITDTLDLQTTKEKSCFHLAPCQWNQWMRSVQSDIKKKTDLFGRKLKIKGADQETAVSMDPLYIRQVLFNFLMNAIEHSFDNSLIEISWKPDTHKDLLILQVADQGPGLSDEDKKKVFDFSYKGRKKEGGRLASGLGLCLAKQIIKAHGGQIHAENRKNGEGALFSFGLPIL